MTLQIVRFIDVVRDVSGGNAKLPQSEFQPSGKLAIVDQGQRFIAGYTDDMTCQFRSESLPVVVFGDHTKAIKYIDFPFAMGADGVKVLKAKDECDSKYLYHFLRQAKIPDAGSSRHFKFLKALEIPLPPLPEQRRIAEILDKADALRAKRHEAIAKLDQLLQSVFLEMFGDPVTNPKGWPQVRFSELLESIDSGTSPVCLDRSASDNEWAVLKLSAVTRCEYDPSANKALPEGVEPDKSLEVKVGDLLFTRKNTRDLVAACAFVTDTPPRLLLPDLIFRFRLKPLAPVVPRYLQALLAFPGKRKDIQSLAGGSAGSMPNISKAKLSNALIELPPTDLQCEFERRLKHCDLLKEQQRLALARLDATFFALQQQAFAGQL